mgnify:CR=1 FL=1
MLKLTDIDMTSTHAQNRTDKPTSTFRQLKRLLVALVVSCAAGFVHADIPDEAIDAYQHGDYAKAYALVLPLAEAGDASAEFALGVFYKNGEGVPENQHEAVAWYRKAAEQGHPSAQLNLGLMYYNGQGVPQDHREAVAWYRKAAEQDFSAAQNGLGVLHEHGLGVAANPVLAYMLYNLASAQGYKLAADNRNRIIDRLTRAQLDEAQALTRNWKLGQPLPTRTKSYKSK